MASPLHVFSAKKAAQTPLAMVALYDAPSAELACDAGIDAVLIGDSLGNTVLGYDTTIPVHVDDIARHLGAVLRGVARSGRKEVAVVADLPLEALTSPQKTLESAVRLMQLGAHAVKIEGVHRAELEALRAIGVPVMGHLGFTPQSELRLQSVVQGRTAREAARLLEDALALQELGVFGLVLEAVASEVAQNITARLDIATVGIGAGSGCDGQVLVWHDLVGLSPRLFKFARQWGDTRGLWREAVQGYVAEVQSGTFPTAENSWAMTADELERWQSSQQDRAAEVEGLVPPLLDEQPF